MWCGEKVEISDLEGSDYTLTAKRENVPELIIDELKPLFGLPKLGKCLVIVNGKEKVATLNYDSTPLSQFKGKFSTSEIDKIRRVLLFRWFLSIKDNGEANVLRFNDPVDFTSFQEKALTDKEEDFAIKQRAFKKYFSTIEEWNNSIDEFLPDDLNYIRNEITDVVKRVDPKWLEVVSFWCSKFSREIEMRK